MKIFIPYLYVGTDELKYCLRSIEKFLPNDGIVIAGSNFPDWLQNVEIVHFQDIHDIRQKQNNELNKLITSLPYLSDDFIYMMDDIFVFRKWEYHYYSRDNKKLSEVNAKGAWRKTLNNAINLIGDVVNYESHTPIVYNKARVKEVNEIIPRIEYGFSLRTIYGHYFQCEKSLIPDVKIFNPLSKKELHRITKDLPYISTADGAWNMQMQEFLEEMYPEKSKFEK